MIIDTWISKAEGSGISRYHAVISTDDYRLTIGSSGIGIPSLPFAVTTSTGPVEIPIDSATARAWGQQLIAAADHFDAQVAVPAPEEAA